MFAKVQGGDTAVKYPEPRMNEAMVTMVEDFVARVYDDKHTCVATELAS